MFTEGFKCLKNKGEADIFSVLLLGGFLLHIYFHKNPVSEIIKTPQHSLL